MGDVAASGGYYIACASDKIFASRNTITGSIGVFGLMWNASELMGKIGISTDGVKTNDHSDIGTTSRTMTEDEKAVIQKSVEDIYGTFISHVGEGRGMKTSEVDSIGQGRVWSGVNAIDIGLIDEFGGLKAAVEAAAELAKLENYKIKELPEMKDFMEELLVELKGDAKTSILKESLGSSYRYYNGLNKVLNTQGIQARIPYAIEIY
jgi:protease-4